MNWAQVATDQSDLDCDDWKFFSLARSSQEYWHVQLLVRSLRTFGGPFSNCAFMLFYTESAPPLTVDPALGPMELIRLDLDPVLKHAYFAAKVAACAQAEHIAAEKEALIWMGSTCLVTGKPEDFCLKPDFDIALRPVHHRNIGIPSDERMDPFWQALYAHVGLEKAPFTAETLVESETILPYYNSHIFATDPSLGLMHTWLDAFQSLALDQDFMQAHCADELHHTFLHQAVLSTLVAKHVPQRRLRILPSTYSYPLHMHDQVPKRKRASSLNELVCPVYERSFHYPESLGGLPAKGALDAWLKQQTAAEDLA